MRGREWWGKEKRVVNNFKVFSGVIENNDEVINWENMVGGVGFVVRKGNR